MSLKLARHEVQYLMFLQIYRKNLTSFLRGWRDKLVMEVQEANATLNWTLPWKRTVFQMDVFELSGRYIPKWEMGISLLLSTY